MTPLKPLKESPDFIALGHISRSHGVHGAVIIIPYTENIELILAGSELLLYKPQDGTYKAMTAHKGKQAAQGLIVKFSDINNRDLADGLRGHIVGIKRQNLPPVEDDEVYLADLLGLNVELKDGSIIGEVNNFMELGSGLTLSVLSCHDQGREHLIPFNHDIILDVDLENKRLLIDPPEGLLEL